MKMIPLLSLLFIAAITGYGQQETPYGNNPAAGKYYRIRGFNMYCETYGQGRPLLLIHGNGGNMSAFKNNIAYFAQKYRVIAVDSRAQGRSADDRDSLSFEMMADDFAVLLDTLKIGKSYVIGWSDGGINALVLAMRHPDKVIKLASSGANLWPDSTALLPAVWKEGQQYYNEHRNTVWKTPKEKNDWKIFLLDWAQPNIPLSDLKKIQCPSLIMCGDHDLIRVEHTVLIYQHIPKARLWVLPDSGHATLMEHAAEFNKKVDEFFE